MIGSYVFTLVIALIPPLQGSSPVVCGNASLKGNIGERRLVFFVQNSHPAFATAVQEKVNGQEGGEKPIDGLQVMNMVSGRDRGQDYIISGAWVFTEKGRVRHRMKYREKRKYYGGKDGLLYKSLVRYTSPPNINRRTFLTWNFKDGERAFWYYRINQMVEAKRTTNLDLLKAPAESDFNMVDYIDVNVEEENHRFVNRIKEEDKTFYVVESIPVNKRLRYGKRISRIDAESLIPIRVDYFDKKGKPWKILRITWQTVEGIWFWKKAEVENLQRRYTTFISFEDVKVNVGLHDREFTKSALERINF